MCSTQAARIARLGEAIDELAVTLSTRAADDATVEEMADRLAGIWAMIAELDPGVAARLPRYYGGD